MRPTVPLIKTVPQLTLENGYILKDVPVAYRTWGRLNQNRDNVILVCHTLTGNTDVDEWWGALLGPKLALDTEKYYIICANVLGSCYGTMGPTNINPQTGKVYGADFPEVTIRDTVALHRLLLEQLGITNITAAIGGSMGGMQVLEWAYYGHVQRLIPISVSGRHSAWCIGWSEAQRQAIYTDVNWKGGYYNSENPPSSGLAAARMIAMLSYRSHNFFSERFGRQRQINGTKTDIFAMESYLHHQGLKLVNRFDANSYITLTEKMDSHDLSRGRSAYPDILRSITQTALVIGFDSDILYPVKEQEELAQNIPNAELAILPSVHGHDSFLIETNQLNGLIRNWLNRN